jgi:hypothetical protein
VTILHFDPPLVYSIKTDLRHSADGADYRNNTATGLVRAGPQRPNVLCEIAETLINKPKYRIHQDGL